MEKEFSFFELVNIYPLGPVRRYIMNQKWMLCVCFVKHAIDKECSFLFCYENSLPYYISLHSKVYLLFIRYRYILVHIIHSNIMR